MGIEVISCPQCGMYYNGTDYEECPYCSRGTVKPIKKQKRKLWRGHATQKPGSASTNSDTIQESVPEVHSPSNTSGVIMSPQLSSNTSGHTLSYSAIPKQQDFNRTLKEEKDCSDAVDNSTVFPPSAEPASDLASAPPKNLEARIDRIEKTTAKYISYANGEITYPVVGWLVGVKGVYCGKSFPLKSGINRIGRSSHFEIPLLLDNSVSHEVVVRILYDPKINAFSALPGESALCYVNGNCIYEKTDLSGHEKIELGDSEKNCFIFVPLCGPSFSWSDYVPQE